MRYPPAAQESGIVLLGSFNPAIFQPAWLVKHELIDEEEYEDVKLSLVHNELTEFRVKIGKIRVEPQRFQIVSKEEPFVESLDLVLGIFSNLLPHTPIAQVGINYSVHFALEAAEQRHRLGRALAPIEPWGVWGQTLDGEVPDNRGGLRSLVMEEPRPNGRDIGHRRVHVEPSVRQNLVDPKVGVHMLVNDHFELKEPDATLAMDWLAERFDASLSESKSIIADLMEFAGGLV